MELDEGEEKEEGVSTAKRGRLPRIVFEDEEGAVCNSFRAEHYW